MFLFVIEMSDNNLNSEQRKSRAQKLGFPQRNEKAIIS